MCSRTISELLLHNQVNIKKSGNSVQCHSVLGHRGLITAYFPKILGNRCILFLKNMEVTTYKQNYRNLQMTENTRNAEAPSWNTRMSAARRPSYHV